MTDQEAKKIYNRKEWKDPDSGARILALRRDHFECQDCRKRLAAGVNLTGYFAEMHAAEHVHHIAEVKDRPDLAFDLSNLISLCHVCHDIRHGRTPFLFNQRKKRITEEKW